MEELRAGSSGTKFSSNVDLEDRLQDQAVEDSKHGTLQKRKQLSHLVRCGSLTSSDTPYQCDICLRTFAKKSSMKTHLKTHTYREDKIYQCDHCSKTFSREWSLKEHMRLNTSKKLDCISELDDELQEGNLFECAECTAYFDTYCLLKEHNLQMGHDKKKHKCKICFKCFLRPSELKTHERVHSGDKPFLCHVCSKSFSVNGNFQRHLKNHSEDRLYGCELCPKRFPTEIQLKRHNKLHQSRPFMCRVCFCCYDYEEKLTKHLQKANTRHKAKAKNYQLSIYHRKLLKTFE